VQKFTFFLQNATSFLSAKRHYKRLSSLFLLYISVFKLYIPISQRLFCGEFSPFDVEYPPLFFPKIIAKNENFKKESPSFYTLFKQIARIKNDFNKFLL
jgi:hypothetical protein